MTWIWERKDFFEKNDRTLGMFVLWVDITGKYIHYFESLEPKSGVHALKKAIVLCFPDVSLSEARELIDGVSPEFFFWIRHRAVFSNNNSFPFLPTRKIFFFEFLALQIKDKSIGCSLHLRFLFFCVLTFLFFSSWVLYGIGKKWMQSINSVRFVGMWIDTTRIETWTCVSWIYDWRVSPT